MKLSRLIFLLQTFFEKNGDVDLSEIRLGSLILSMALEANEHLIEKIQKKELEKND